MLNVINAIEEKLQAQKDEIFFKDMQIKDLKEKLQAAENERDAMAAKLKAVESYIEQNEGATA